MGECLHGGGAEIDHRLLQEPGRIEVRRHRAAGSRRVAPGEVRNLLGEALDLDHGEDIVDIIVKQPASASFIVGKIFSFFAYPKPPDAVLQPFVDVYTRNDYSIRAVVRAILTSDAFYSSDAYRALVKSPAEFVPGTLRTLDIATDGTGLPGIMRSLLRLAATNVR